MTKLAQNGHGAAEQAARALAHERRRRELAASYAGLSDSLLDSFESLALAQEPPVRLGSLQLVALIRRRRLREQMRVQA